MVSKYDVVVIGGGIAGASVAGELAKERSVLLAEMEDQPGYHSTGRSAALFILTYGNDIVRALTRASRDFFYQPLGSFCTNPLVHPRAILLTAEPGMAEQLEEFLETIAPGDHFERKTVQEAVELMPILRPDAISGALFNSTLADIEVHELHQGYLRMLKAEGGRITTNAGVSQISRTADHWVLTIGEETIHADIIVNAAGAWAGEIAGLAGAQDLGLRPLRRTVCLVAPPVDSHSEAWPMLADVADKFYLKPDAGMLLISPSDETLSPPCDAQPDELDIAIAIDRIEQATTLTVRRVTHKWAGLRTFAKDRSPVIGFDALRPSFFWHAGFGGFGIQTAPAASRLAASIIAGRQPDADIVAAGLDVDRVAPTRFTRTIAA